MPSADFLSTTSVVMLLAAVALLAGVSAAVLAPIERFQRRRGMIFMVCLAIIWAGAVLFIWLIRRTI